MRHLPPLQVPPNTYIANTLPSTSTSWFPNSVASYHVTGDAKIIEQATPFEGPDHIYTENDHGLHISSDGSSSFSFPFHPHM